MPAPRPVPPEHLSGLEKARWVRAHSKQLTGAPARDVRFKSIVRVCKCADLLFYASKVDAREESAFLLDHRAAEGAAETTNRRSRSHAYIRCEREPSTSYSRDRDY